MHGKNNDASSGAEMGMGGRWQMPLESAELSPCSLHSLG